MVSELNLQVHIFFCPLFFHDAFFLKVRAIDHYSCLNPRFRSNSSFEIVKINKISRGQFSNKSTSSSQFWFWISHNFKLYMWNRQWIYGSCAMCVDNVIWTGRDCWNWRWIENFCCLCFFILSWNHFRAPSRSRKGCLISLQKLQSNHPSFRFSRKQKNKDFKM